METALSYAARPDLAPTQFDNRAGRGDELLKLGNEALEFLSNGLAPKAKEFLDAYVEPDVRPAAPNYYELEEIWTSFDKDNKPLLENQRHVGRVHRVAQAPRFPRLGLVYEGREKVRRVSRGLL